jgi:type III secretion protein R
VIDFGFPEPLSLFLALAALGLLPFLAVMVTSFAKIHVVLTLTRNALGVQQAPPSMVLNSMALILTAYIMAPVGFAAYEPVKAEVESGKVPVAQVIFKIAQSGREPLVAFMSKHAHERERAFFVSAAKRLWPEPMARALDPNSLLVVVPAFLISQVTDAFIIGMIVYLTFIVVDFIVAGVLLALGMSMISPTVVSVPFKLLAFIAVDGWSMLLHNLVLTYR